MKKTYTKPEIIFEDFTLNTNIAAGCEAKTELPSYNQCGVEYSGLMIFMTGMTGCKDIQVTPVDGDGDAGGICYHVPTNGVNVFTS